MKYSILLTLTVATLLGVGCQGEDPSGFQLDSDGDGIIDSMDNCRYSANSDQADDNNNGVGNACDPTYHPPISDGAYSGVVVNNYTVILNGVSAPGVTTGNRVIEIVSGELDAYRVSPDGNGPFDCCVLSVGAKRTTPLAYGSLSGNMVQTITSVSTRGAHYVVNVNISGTQLSGPLSGEGDITIDRQSDGTLAYNDHYSVSGILASNYTAYATALENTTTGTLSRIGSNGTLPIPNGMNGIWLHQNAAETWAEGFEIRSLRVISYAETAGVQNITSSQPVTSSTSPGSNVFISFQGLTSFNSDPTTRLYTITFRGTVQNNGTITGKTTYEAPGVTTKTYDTKLERVPSSSC